MDFVSTKLDEIGELFGRTNLFYDAAIGSSMAVDWLLLGIDGENEAWVVHDGTKSEDGEDNDDFDDDDSPETDDGDAYISDDLMSEADTEVCD